MQKNKKTHKRILIGFLFAALVVSNTIMWAGHIGTLTPYAISIDDQEICRVKNKCLQILRKCDRISACVWDGVPYAQAILINRRGDSRITRKNSRR